MAHHISLPKQFPKFNFHFEHSDNKKSDQKGCFEAYIEKMNREHKLEGLQFDEFGNPFLTDDKN